MADPLLCPTTVNRYLIIGFVAAIVSTTTCTSSQTSTSSPVGPSGEKCQVSATASRTTFGAPGGEGTVNVTASRDCTWSAATDASWIAVVGDSSGQGDAALKYTVAENSVPTPRRGSLTVAAQQLSISQDAAPCRFGLDRTDVQMSSAGGSFVVRVSTLTGCSWTASTNAPWILLQGPSGNGTGSLTVTIAPNKGASRSGQVSVGDQTVLVTQQAEVTSPPPNPSPEPPPPTPNPAPTPTPTPNPAPPSPPDPGPSPSPPCSFTLSRTSQTFPSNGGETTVAVTTSTGCSWSALSTVSWVSVVSGSTGTGSGQVRLSVASNPLPVPRTGVVTIAGQAFTISEDPAPTSIELSGVVVGLQGSCPNLTFQLVGYVVLTDSKTDYAKKDSCGKVKTGIALTLKGSLRSDGTVHAEQIDLN